MKNTSSSSLRMYLFCYITFIIMSLSIIYLYVSVLEDLSPHQTEIHPLEHLQNLRMNENAIIWKATDSISMTGKLFMRYRDAAGNINHVELKRYYEPYSSSIVITDDERGIRRQKHPQ